MPSPRTRTPVHRPVVWVVGASRGIGREIADQFATLGCLVCLTGRSRRDLGRAVSFIRDRGGHALSFPCDITDRNAVSRTARLIGTQAGPVDILVNNAGITVFSSFLRTSLDQFDEVISTNLLGQIACMKAVVPGMVKRKRGWIFNILSTASKHTFEDSSAYTAAKAGMLALANVVREEFRPWSIRVVNVLPGPTATGMWSRDSLRRHSKRMMTAKEVAQAVVSLYRFPPGAVPEELLIRPVKGDLS